MATVDTVKLIVLLCISMRMNQAADIPVDLAGAGCDNLGYYELNDPDDVITIFHLRQYNTQPTRDQCDVRVRAPQGRRIRYLVETMKFDECGAEIIIYDNPGSDIRPRHTFRCNSNNAARIRGETRYNELRLRLRKTTPESRIFNFAMKLINDLGPDIDFLQDDAEYAGQSLDPGVIAGIAIAGAVVIIVLILIAIYLCIRARKENMKADGASSTKGESSVYTTGNSQVPFATRGSRFPRYGSTEDVRSTTSSQEKTNGAYANPAYTKGPGEARSERSSSVGRARGKTAFSNEVFDAEDMGGGGGQGDLSWEEREGGEIAPKRQSRRDAYEKGPLKSALKKPTEIEMSKVSTQPNGILKTRTHSPNRSQTSSTDASLDTNAIVYGYGHQGKDIPNVHHKPVLERKRSRSGPRSHRSGSSAGRHSSRERRSQSADKKKVKSSRMYSDDVFIDDRSRRSRSSDRRRPRSESSRKTRSERSDRTSDSIDSASSTTSYSRKVSMNPGGRRVHIKGEETDI